MWSHQRTQVWLALVLATAVFWPLRAQGIELKSTFDRDTEGWNVNVGPMVHRASGGNPGGYLFVDNPESDPVVMIAPGKFRGDLRAFDGGVLNFDGNMFRQGPPPSNRPWRDEEAAPWGGNYGAITIQGGGLTARKDVEPGLPPLQSWRRYSTPLTAQNFGVSQEQWLRILAGVTRLTISVEAIFGEEQQGFDNFVLSANCPSALLAEGEVYQSSCPPSKRPVPEEVVIEATKDPVSGRVNGEVVVEVDGGSGFTKTWTMALSSSKVITYKKSGRAPSLVQIFPATDARDGDVAFLLWEFEGGATYTTQVNIVLRQTTPPPPTGLCNPPQPERLLVSWSYPNPPTFTGGADWLKAEKTRDATATQPPVYRLSKDPMGLPPGTYSGSIKYDLERIICDTFLNVPPELPKIGLPPSVRFDVYATDRLNLLQDIPISNPSQTQSMRWRLKSSNKVSWVDLQEESGVVGPGQSGRITVVVRTDRLFIDQSTTYLNFAADGFADGSMMVTADKSSSPRPFEVEPLGLAITPQQGQTITIRNPTSIAITVLVSTDSLVGDDLGLRATPATLTIPAEGSATVTVQMTNTRARASSEGVVQIRDPVSGDLRQVVVTAANQASAPRAAVLAPGGSPQQGACRPVDLVPVFARPGVNVQAPVGVPVPIQVQVLDDCGQPLRQGQVTVEPANGDSGLFLVPRGDGRWFGAWAPLRESTGFFSLRALAFSTDGRLFGESTIPARVARNPAPPPVVETGSIVSAASLTPNRPHAPGEIVSLFGVGLAERQEAATGFPLPTRLGGLSIQIGGTNMPLLFASAGQVNGIIPFGLPAKSLQPVVLQRGSQVSTPGSILIVDAQPAVFTVSQGGQGPGVIVDANFRLVNAANPARAGDVVIVFLTGLGEADPAVGTGAPAPGSPPSRTRLPVTVTIGGQAAEVLFAGLAPGFAGLYQINLRVPAGTGTGAAAPLVVTTYGLSSPPATMAVQ